MKYLPLPQIIGLKSTLALKGEWPVTRTVNQKIYIFLIIQESHLANIRWPMSPRTLGTRLLSQCLSPSGNNKGDVTNKVLGLSAGFGNEPRNLRIKPALIVIMLF